MKQPNKISKRLKSLHHIKHRPDYTGFSFRFNLCRRLMDKATKSWPPEIWEALHISAHEFIGLETSQRYDAIVDKFPSYFPWESTYRFIVPKEVHKAYRKEAGIMEWDDIIKAWDNNDKVDYNEAPSGGILQQIQSAGKESSFTQDNRPLQDIINEWIERDAREQDRIYYEQQKAIAIWDKHYSPYGLEYRD